MTAEAIKPTPFKDARRLLLRTTPFLMLNVVVYGGFFLATVLWLGLFGGLAAFFSTRVEVLAWVFILIAIAVPSGVMAFARRYVLYLVKGAHIAVVTKLLVEGELPEGKKQVAYGREVVQSNFRDVSILFALDRIIDRVVKRFTNRFVRLVDWLPLGGGASRIARWAAQIVQRSLSYVDEAILSYAIALNEANVWRSARHGLILYAQVYKPVLKTAVKVWLMGRVAFLGALLIFGIPGVLLLMTFNAIWFQIVVIVGTLLLASLAVRAVFEPFATTYTLVTYHGAITGVEINATWDQRLQSVSDEFRKLVGQAREHSDTPDPVDQMQPSADGIDPTTPVADAPGTPAANHPAGTPAGPAGIAGQAPPARQAAPAAGLGGVLGGALGGGRRRGAGGLIGGMVAKAAQDVINQRQAAPPAQTAPPAPAADGSAAPAAPAPAADGAAPAAPAGEEPPPTS